MTGDTGGGTVVITGASRGIGRACAQHLEASGFEVFAGVRDRARAGLLDDAGGRIRLVDLDVSDPASVAAAASEVAAAVGDRGLAGLVNNAGFVVGGPLEHVPLDELRRQFEVNVFGVVAVTQRFLPLLRSGGGRLVNVSSVAGLVAQPFLGPYSASKFALEALTDSMRLELRPFGIRVSLVEAGAIATEIWDASFEAADARMSALPQEARALYGPAYARARAAMARLGRRATPPEAVARAVGHALGARRPRPRYRVGRTSTLVRLVSLLPDRMRDRLVRLYLGV